MNHIVVKSLSVYEHIERLKESKYSLGWKKTFQKPTSYKIKVVRICKDVKQELSITNSFHENFEIFI